MIIITFALTVLFILAFICGSFNLPVDHGFVANTAKAMFYMAIAAAWFWLYESYKAGVHLKFLKG